MSTAAPEDAKLHIQAELKKLENKHGMRILTAVESGSRLWGFPSEDSDYDVRFIYARPPKNYLTVYPIKDVIECPIEYSPTLGVPLDVSGWDVKKAIDLAGKSNRAFVEWVQSPIVYVQTPISDRISAFVKDSVNLMAMFNHYVGWTKKIYKECGNVPNAKAYCYAIRSALSADYISRYRRIPPPDIQALAQAHPDGALLSSLLNALLDKKAIAHEALGVERISTIDTIIESVLRMPSPEILSPELCRESADQLFLAAIGCDPAQFL